MIVGLAEGVIGNNSTHTALAGIRGGWVVMVLVSVACFLTLLVGKQSLYLGYVSGR